LFDVWTKEDEGEKRTSYAFRLVFQSQERTLSDDEINVVMEDVTNVLNNKKGWEVR
jgi:phenylalanyl-tRNA synthetase beta subunit